MRKRTAALQNAIEAAGTAAELAKKLGITAQALSQWRVVPPNRVLEIERITGVSRHELRPDLYPREEAPRQIEARHDLI